MKNNDNYFVLYFMKVIKRRVVKSAVKNKVYQWLPLHVLVSPLTEHSLIEKASNN